MEYPCRGENKSADRESMKVRDTLIKNSHNRLLISLWKCNKYSPIKHQQLKRNLMAGNATLYDRHHARLCAENMFASPGLIGKSAVRWDNLYAREHTYTRAHK